MGISVLGFQSSKGKISGGFTTVEWSSKDKYGYKEDKDAFLFSVDHKKKYPCNDHTKAVYHCSHDSFEFGGRDKGCLSLYASHSNHVNGGRCSVAGQGTEGDIYNVELDLEGNSILTGDGKDNGGKFTCIECEVYLVSI